MSATANRYLCLSVDVEGYGRHNDVEQARIQQELVDLLDRAGTRADTDRSTWIRQPKGDEELALIPASEPPPAVVGEFCLELHSLLRERNEGLAPADRLRLRLAIDDGPVELSANGFAGRAVVGVSRLVNSRALRMALATIEGAQLVVLVSQVVFRDWIHSGRSSVAADQFQRVRVAEKEFVEHAWLWVPGTTSPPWSLLSGAGPATNLPADDVHFTGRAAEMARVTAIFAAPSANAATICTVSGQAGVGKTMLAVHAARRLEDRFADGCLYLDLLGYTAGSQPMSPADGLDALLRQLGVGGDGIPATVHDRSIVLQHRLRQQQILLVLDNAFDTAQVRPLLPNEPGCAAIVTSRRRLTALDGAHHVELASLSEADAVQLLHTVAGEDRLRSKRDFEVAAAIVARCAGLPLAVRIAAARLRIDATLGMGDLYGRLEDEHGRLYELDDGERSATATIAVSVERLSTDQRQLFALLALHPSGEFDLHAATALAGTTVARARRLVDGLADLYLLERPREGRYRFHDLVGAFARTQPIASTEDRDRAVRRLVRYYMIGTDHADRLITPSRFRPPLAVTDEEVELPAVDDADAAIAWLTANEGTLADMCQVAQDVGHVVECWQLAYALRGYYFLAKRWDLWVRTHRIALTAARRAGDRRAEAMTLNNLGMAMVDQDRIAATAHYQRALAIFDAVGDEHGAVSTRVNLAWLAYAAGQYDDFVRELIAAHAFYVHTGAQRNAAIALRGIALGETALGNTDRAIAHLHEVEIAFVQLGLDHDLVMTVNALGEAYARSGDAERARAYHQRALDLGARRGGAFEMARADHRLGELAARDGDVEDARLHWHRAYQTYVELDAIQAAELARLLDLHGGPDG